MIAYFLPDPMTERHGESVICVNAYSRGFTLSTMAITFEGAEVFDVHGFQRNPPDLAVSIGLLEILL
jgi:hypothetical protein